MFRFLRGNFPIAVNLGKGVINQAGKDIYHDPWPRQPIFWFYDPLFFGPFEVKMEFGSDLIRCERNF
jgi:hypothetical protein